MTLTLAIHNSGRLANGAPAELTLDRRGAIVGRAATCDWSLPDPAKHISARHFEVTFDGRSYLLSDISTNGTFLNGASDRLRTPHRIAEGDRIQVGPYLIHASLRGGADVAQSAPNDAAPPRGWAGWDDGSGPAGARPEANGSAAGWGAPVGNTGWDAAPALPRDNSRWQPDAGPSLARLEAHRPAQRSESPPARAASGGWAPSAAAPLAPVASAWESAAPDPDPASGWSSAAPDRPATPSPDDVWGRIAEGNVVDWARGGFGQPGEPKRDPLGLAPAPASAALPAARPVAPAAPPRAAPGAGGAEFFSAAGIAPAIDDPAKALSRAGALFHKLVAGLVVMVEARARAKAQLGAEATAFSPQGHNPLKFARTPEEALAMLIEPPQRGFMPADRAIEDAFLDLQSHQMATLKAMQGALRATLDRFSPTAIRARADDGGMLERILPAARDAALWQAYEREFGGVAQGSDEAFMDVFAKEFRRAYNDQARRNQ